MKTSFISRSAVDPKIALSGPGPGWRKLVFFGVALALFSCGGISDAQVTFDAAVDYNVGQRPDGIAAGDFDGDLDLDMAVVTNGATGNLELIEIFLNNGDGTFTFGSLVVLPNSSSPNELVAADFDGDMDIDMVVILRDFQQIQLVRNTGGGVFVLDGTAAVGDRARGMTIGDFDSDDDFDLAVANRNDNTATILTNDGTGAFTPSTLAIAGEPRAVAFVDIDGNADIDCAVTNNDDRNVALFTNTGTGFSLAGTISTGPVHRPEGIVAADLDGDGTQDLAVALNDNVQPDAVAVFLNQGGAFGAATRYLTGGQNTSGILAADFNCDNVVDLATRNEDSNDISLLPNLGGTFGAPTMLATGLAPSQLVVCDLDGDNDNDLAVSNRDSNTFSVLRNNCGILITTVMPASFSVTRGNYVSGGIVELGMSDNLDLAIQRGVSDTQSRTEFEVAGTSPTANPTTLEVTLEGAVFARSTVVQTIELYDYVAAAWELVDTRDATNMTDSTVTIVATGDLSRFVDPATLSIEARVRFQSLSVRQRFASNTDQFIWTIQ